MKFRTEVDIPGYPFRIDHRSPVLMMGSCFTDYMGSYLHKYLFDVCINPFGVIYNPLSIHKALTAILDKEEYTEDDLELYNDLYFSFNHYTGFSHPDKHKALENINRSFKEARRFIHDAHYLFLTFGTSYVYRYNKSGEIVCNCHKMPASAFSRERLTPEMITDALTGLFNRLQQVNRHLKIIFTISPVRHWKDGAHGNQVSKSILLLAVNRLCSFNPESFFYFPSYEMMMDDLRDYRFYAEDLIHLNNVAVTYIWEKFASAFFTDETRQVIEKLDSLLKAFQHKPVHPDSITHKKFVREREKRLTGLKSNYPYLPWSKFNN
ncbi:MAG TPA: GSCFA domain protein [Bacteroidaceae bacterium]|nr:GSCFA domain protein [Bacteroidaceae bacterium]